MKSILLAICLVASALSVTAHAQTAAQAQGEVQFTDEQAMKIKKIAQIMRSAAQQIAQSTELTDQQKVVQLDAVTKKGKEAIMSLLTPAQKAALAKNQN